jgi:hypothetical protein
MTDVLELLRRDDPVDADRLRAEEPPRETLTTILASPPPRRPRRPRARGRLLVPAVGAALAAIVAVAVLVGGGARPDEAAAAALRKVADVARAQPPTLPAGDGRLLYFRTDSEVPLPMAGEPPFHRGIDSEDDVAFLVRTRNTQEVWVGEHRGLVRNTSGAPAFPSERDREAWIAAGRPRLPQADSFDSELQGMERLRIPTDPDALLDYLHDRAADRDHGEAYIFEDLIGDYLREWGVTPEQRAALYDVAARLPGIELMGRRTDSQGRTGVAFAMRAEDRAERVTLLIDPDTAELLAITRVTLPGSPIPPGTTWTQTFSSPVLVDGMGERP